MRTFLTLCLLLSLSTLPAQSDSLTYIIWTLDSIAYDGDEADDHIWVEKVAPNKTSKAIICRRCFRKEIHSGEVARVPRPLSEFDELDEHVDTLIED